MSPEERDARTAVAEQRAALTALAEEWDSRTRPPYKGRPAAVREAWACAAAELRATLGSDW